MTPDIDTIPNRKPIDSHVNQHGKSFIDFLLEAKLCILNGRVSRHNDNYTCISSRGTSVVDCILTCHNSLNMFEDFNVMLRLVICNRLVNLGISKQQHLYLKTKNLI